MNGTENQIARLSLQGRLEYLPEATALVRGLTAKLGLTDGDARRMELVVEEACVNVIKYAFEGETGSLDIIISRRPGQIVLAIEDQGLPIDFTKLAEGRESGLGIALMKAMADEVHFVNLGRGGQRVEVIKHLPAKNESGSIQETAEKTAALPAVAESDITIRLMHPEEAISLARCAYRCYGYTYASDIFYFPERVSELVSSGLMISAVAVDSSGEIIGHIAVTKEKANSVVGESGQAIVDPRYRGGGILKKIGHLQAETVRAQGLLGSYAEGVTVHTSSQRFNMGEGGKETGVLLGFTPAGMYFKSIQTDQNTKRRAVLFLYSIRNPGPPRTVYLPVRHEAILRRIYAHSGLVREFPAAQVCSLPERAQVDVRVQTEASRGFLRVVQYGRDLEDVVRYRLKELCDRRVDVIYLDLPLNHPAVREYCTVMEKLGFFFGSVIPEIADGDALRLQYINHAELELQDVQLATDFARELLHYVLKAGGFEKENDGPPAAAVGA
jgi:anti-sigma regulatory factor (Ser/Thr protein kinase)